jgi:hypothetical protein
VRGAVCARPIRKESLKGAKKEGALVVYTSMTVDQMQKILDAFKARYPFIRTSMFRAVDDFNKNFELFRSIFGAPRS